MPTPTPTFACTQCKAALARSSGTHIDGLGTNFPHTQQNHADLLALIHTYTLSLLSFGARATPTPRWPRCRLVLHTQPTTRAHACKHSFDVCCAHLMPALAATVPSGPVPVVDEVRPTADRRLEVVSECDSQPSTAHGHRWCDDVCVLKSCPRRTGGWGRSASVTASPAPHMDTGDVMTCVCALTCMHG